ncbi:MAG: phytoene/squalene synthase family protein [Pyrinomonadaceae bacterium]|nr:phytoene/squalene synthase family protein [Pyrinomonadaceae bacterium]MDQ3133983.1 phytoene/squalene synthase family protein [Acidobacteriota bacterium]
MARISPASADEVERSYEFCRRTTRHHAKSFYFCTQFLPREKRRAIYAVYALCRHVDDEVDEAGVSDEAGARAAVEKWQSDLEKVYRGESATQSPVLIAWGDMLKHYVIARELPLELMRGVLMDTYQKRYESWEELRLYCYRVASVVGLMTSEIFGYERPETLRYAEALGLAMQLTNILRDVGEDLRMGRVYLPQDELRRFGVTTEALRRGTIDQPFRELMRFEIRRARALYAEAEQGIPLLERDARFTVLLAARLYGRILDEIENNDFQVFERRAHLSFGQKLRAVPRLWRAARRLR